MNPVPRRILERFGPEKGGEILNVLVQNGMLRPLGDDYALTQRWAEAVFAEYPSWVILSTDGTQKVIDHTRRVLSTSN